MNRSSAGLRREDSKKYKHSALRARREGGDSLVVVTLSGPDFPTGSKHQYSAATTGGGGSTDEDSFPASHFHGLREPQRGMMTFRVFLTVGPDRLTGEPSLNISSSCASCRGR